MIDRSIVFITCSKNTTLLSSDAVACIFYKVLQDKFNIEIVIVSTTRWPKNPRLI